MSELFTKTRWGGPQNRVAKVEPPQVNPVEPAAAMTDAEGEAAADADDVARLIAEQRAGLPLIPEPPQRNFRIKVAAKHFVDGKPCHRQKCPLALALADCPTLVRLGAFSIDVHDYTISFNLPFPGYETEAACDAAPAGMVIGIRVRYRPPFMAAESVCRVDEKSQPRPFTFSLNARQ